MNRFIAVFFFMVCSYSAYTWTALGHKLVAQIAYDNLSPEARQTCGTYFNIKNPLLLEFYFVRISTWMDDIRKKKVHQYDHWHYIDIPFARDHTKLPELSPINALWAINHALLVLSSDKEPTAKKALYLKILIHLVGDIHQPLHATTKVSRRLPKGDLGGNLYLLSKTPDAANLHQYWDKGAGMLTDKQILSIILKARILEKRWPCSMSTQQQKPEQWVYESHEIAVNEVYTLRGHKRPSRHYQLSTQETVNQQIALAGCRLAYVLNTSA
jgi:hypothetical protein